MTRQAVFGLRISAVFSRGQNFRFASSRFAPLAGGMGFFDRFATKKPSPAQPLAASPAVEPAATPVPPAPASVTPPSTSSATSIAASLLAARERLDARDLPGALALYEPVLASAGDRPDVLVTISGDLGSTGHVEAIVELIAPRYDAERHGPATGLNLLQAYLATRNATAAQHLLDILFALQRPEWEERLYGFSNALGELIEAENHGLVPPAGAATPEGAARPAQANTISLVSISKPIWLYGLEPIADRLLPAKGDRLRRIAFAQLAVPGKTDAFETMKDPEDELGRLSRALPLWLAETFSFAPAYAPIAAVGMVNEARHYALFPSEWTTDNLRQLVETSSGGLDYVVTGSIRQVSGDTEVLLRVWEIKKFRERKQFSARWSPATADVELIRLHEQVRLFMEWSGFPAGKGLAYQVPTSPRAWLDVLGASLTLFLGEKELLAPTQLTTLPPALAVAGGLAVSSEAASLAWLTLNARAKKLQVSALDQGNPALADSPLVQAARETVG